MFGWDKIEDDTVVHTLASAIRRDISFGVLTPDQKLKIDDLRTRYGGSKHSLRETLRVLSTEGLVEAVAQRGFRVTSATEKDLHDISLVRIEIEKVALTRSIELGRVQWEGRVVAAHHALKKIEASINTDVDNLAVLEWDEACRVFYAVLFEACDSARLIDLQRKFFDQSRRFRLALLREGELDFERRSHRLQAIVDAVLERDVEKALPLLEEDIRDELRTVFSVK